MRLVFPHKTLESLALLALSTTDLPTGQLVALAPIANDALKGQALPTRIKLLNWGDNETVTKGIVKVGQNTLKALASNQALYGYDNVALDYGHNSLPSHPNFKPDPREVAGYGALEVVENDGLYLTALSYTPSGQKMALNYRDFEINSERHSKRAHTPSSLRYGTNREQSNSALGFTPPWS